MAVVILPYEHKPLSNAVLAEWREIPTTVISDELNRASATAAAIRPLRPGMRFAGQALTVECFVGDNLAIHYALERLWPGAIVMVDGRGHVDTAIWGENIHTCAEQRGAAGVVIDGAIRDSEGIGRSALPLYCRGICPRGASKGWGGSVFGPIQCGGVSVASGDLVVADDDGVVVVRPEQQIGLMARCRKKMARETDIIARIRGGESTVQVLGLPPLVQGG